MDQTSDGDWTSRELHNTTIAHHQDTSLNHVTESVRPLTASDVTLVSSQLGTSWRTLGLRLNFSSQTLDAIEAANSFNMTRDYKKVAGHMLSAWSKLPSATVGRLALVLWEMGLHYIATQLHTHPT